MPAAYWVVIGILLFCAELFVVDAQFYLVFIGVSAVVVGLLGLAGVAMPEAAQWVLFAVLALVAMVGFRRRIYDKLRRPKDTLPQVVMVGERVWLPAALAPGDTCRVEFRGTSWTARNADDASLNGEVEIAQIEGLTLAVRARRGAA